MMAPLPFLSKLLSKQNHKNRRPDRRTKFNFRHEWDFPVPAETIWGIVTAPENWPSFFYGFSIAGNDIGESSLTINSNFFFTIKGSLPYSLLFHARVIRMEPEKSLVVKVHGDLKGLCTFDIDPQSETTKIVFDMSVSPAKFWIKLLAPAAKKFFVKNHNLVVDRSYHSFKNRIAMETS